MAMGRNATRTILVELGDLRPFSDVGGRHAIRMNDSAEKRKSLAQRLDTAGCHPDISGTDWLSAGDFSPPPKLGGGLPLGKRVPATQRAGAHVDGHWYDKGSRSRADVKITNNGALPIRNVQLVVPDGVNVTIWQNEPVRRLPVGKSFTVQGDNHAHVMGGNGPNQFDLLVVGRLEDGSEFRQDVYFDAG